MKHIHPDLTRAFYKRRSTNSREFKRGDGSTNVVIDVVHVHEDLDAVATAAGVEPSRETLIILHIPGARFVPPNLKWTLAESVAAFEPLPVLKWKQRKRERS